MNKQQAENLRALIRHMETKCERRLDMTVYFRCGAPACALGEACAVPALVNLGVNPTAVMDDALSLVYRLFGDVYSRLFSGNLHRFPERHSVSPQEWATEARKVLAEHGYSMDDKPDAFEAFMGKALEPVPLESAALFLFER